MEELIQQQAGEIQQVCLWTLRDRHQVVSVGMHILAVHTVLLFFRSICNRCKPMSYRCPTSPTPLQKWRLL